MFQEDIACTPMTVADWAAMLDKLFRHQCFWPQSIKLKLTLCSTAQCWLSLLVCALFHPWNTQDFSHAPENYVNNKGTIGLGL